MVMVIIGNIWISDLPSATEQSGVDQRLDIHDKESSDVFERYVRFVKMHVITRQQIHLRAGYHMPIRVRDVQGTHKSLTQQRDGISTKFYLCTVASEFGGRADTQSDKYTTIPAMSAG